MNDKQNVTDKGTTDNDGAIQKQSTGKQLVAIVFILSIATKMFLFPIFLIQTTGRDAYIAVAIGGGFDLIMLGILLLALAKSGDNDFFTLLTNVFGKPCARIISAVIALFMFFKLNVGVAESLMFYADSVFTDFSVPVMIFVLLIFFVSVGMHTLRAVCRLNELLIPLVLAGLAVLIAIVIMTGYDFANIYPVLQDGGSFRYELVKHAAWVGDFTPLVLFIGRTKATKRSVICSAVGGVIGTAVVVFFSLVLCAAFGNAPLLVDTSTNITSILQFSVGNIYGRIDMFSAILWSVAAFIANALFFYSTCRCISFAIGKSAHMVITVAVCAATYFLQVFVMTDQTLFSVVVTSLPSSIITPILSTVIALLAAICALLGGKKKSKKSGGKADSKIGDIKTKEVKSDHA